jgi:hypothetical protein
MVVCLTSARFNMKADILRAVTDTPDDPETTDVDEGDWTVKQDPDSGAIIRDWEPNVPDDPETEENEAAGLEPFNLIARGVVQGGVKASEQFSDLYNAADYVRISFPPNVVLSRRDRVTNIRSSKGVVIWLEEEGEEDLPTIFSVTGVTPVIDPFGNHVENTALLERVQAQ